MTRALALLVALAACKQDAAPAPAPPSKGPHCYRLAPGQPSNPAGDVTIIRYDFSVTPFRLDSVWTSQGRTGTTHLRFHAAGDHYDADAPGVSATLDGPADAPSKLTLRQHDAMYDYAEVTAFDPTGLTETSVDPKPDGSKQRTTTRFVSVACAQVDADLSR